jgi:hypothetical protein
MQFECIVEFDVGYQAYIVEAETARGAIAMVNAVQPEQYVYLKIEPFDSTSDFNSPDEEYILLGLTAEQVQWG